MEALIDAPMRLPVAKTEFRDAMARLAAAVSVITSDGPSGLAGCTATAVCSVTDDPPTLLACINRASRNNQALRDNGRLCVNVLGADQQAIGQCFADGTLSVADRFAAVSWLRDADGQPALADAGVSIGCDISQITEVGSHSVFFCTVTAVRVGDDRGALLYLGRDFHEIARQSVTSDGPRNGG